MQLSKREIAQITAALRFWGRTQETSISEPSEHPMCMDRFKKHLPMSLDEIESLIGRLDGTWESRKPRPWNPWRE